MMYLKIVNNFKKGDLMSKKVQKTIYLDPKLIRTLEERATINNRNLSGEIQHMLQKKLEIEQKYNRQALDMLTDPETLKQTEQQ